MSQRSARRRDLRLLPVAAVTWAGAGAAILLPGSAVWIAGGLWAASVGAIALAGAVARRHRSAAPPTGGRRPITALALAAVALAFAGAAASHVAAAEPERSSLAALEISGGRALTIDADVVGKIETSATGFRFDAVLRRATIGAQVHEVSAPVLVRVSERPVGLDLGSQIRATATAFPADPGDRAVLVVTASALEARPPHGILAGAAALRAGLIRSADGLPPPGAGLIAGLAVGDTSALDDELDAQMKASSLSHLTAVSGANCALVVGIAYALSALCGARRGIRVATGLATLMGFVVLVSPEPSVVRAATMAAVAMLGLLLGRIGAGVSVLSVSVCVLLILDPWLAASLGFALSAVATGSLLLFAGPLAAGLTKWMPAPVALAVSVPLAAQLACGPLLILIEPTVPLLGVLANLIAGPAAPAATVVGLLACLALPIPVLASGLAAVAWLPASWIAATASTAAGVKGASLGWLEGFPGLVVLALTGAAIGIVIAAPAGRPRRAAAALCAAVVIVTVAAAPVRLLLDRARVPAEWSIAACDVGQGDAVLVRDGGQTMLIDTGPDAAALSACLDRFAVARIDVLVLTHFDLDHRGGADALNGRVALVLHGPAATPEDDAVVEQLRAGGARTQQVSAGQGGTLGECRWGVLWPRPRDPVYPSGNDASVTLRVTGCRVPDALFLGDLSGAAQRSLASTGAIARGVRVVKVAHHGSADQDSELYRSLDASVALVTVGENTYGHPRSEILDLLSDEGAAIARTDSGGDVAVWESEGALRVWRSRGDDAG
ncbi:ComEC/Rec2 family competence protein [Microbacterium sp.]|uniref:ComEC/Rec2 family competence protein n=1 Tax=Microbacterium sp. TaxID=51671 RepID=UPI0037361851